MTADDFLSDVQSLMAEQIDGGVSWPSQMWTPSEVNTYADHAQRKLLAGTGLVLTRAVLLCTPHVLRQLLPQDWLATIRLTWVRTSDNHHFPLERSDIWELDTALPNWRTEPGTPGFYTDGDVQTLTVQIVPAPSVSGALKLTYIAEPAAIVAPLSASTLVVPDDVSVELTWDTISYLLAKEGYARDPRRAEIASQRATMLMEAVKVLLKGWA